MKFLISIFALITLVSTSAWAVYNYPYANPLIATASTVLVKSSECFAYKEFTLTPQPGRTTLPIVGDEAQLWIRIYQQPDPADLVVLIPGLGSNSTDDIANYLADLLFAKGFSVLILPNAFSWRFALAASRTGLVGMTSQDAADLLATANAALNYAKANLKLQVQQVDLVGLSLGALESAFVAAQDAQNPQLHIQKTVLINPPSDILYGMNVLDQMYEVGNHMPESVREALQENALALALQGRGESVNAPNYFLGLNQKLNLPEPALEYLIGQLYHSSLAEIIYASQFVSDLGVLKTAATPLRQNAREAEADQFSFVGYMNNFVMLSLGKSESAADLDKNQSLTAIAGFLKNGPVYLMTNQDDFILAPNSIATLKQIFGNRAIIYPHGGHLGNIWYPQNQRDLVSILN